MEAYRSRYPAPVPFFLAFLAIAVTEVALFAAAWTAIGPLWTIGLALATGVVGSWLVWHQGLGILDDVRASLNMGRFPGRELAHGALVLVGGALLLTPGFLTDFVGLSLMAWPVRDFIRRSAERRLRSRLYV